MNRKSVFLTLALLFLSIGLTPACEAKQKLRSSKFTVWIYFPTAPMTYKDSIFYSTIATPQGVYYGTYQAPIFFNVEGTPFTNLTWTGPGAAPTWVVNSAPSSVKDSYCPGMPGDFVCKQAAIDITVASDDYGCPWISSTYVIAGGNVFPITYRGPTVRYSVCPKVPVDTYDISWSPDYVQHDKTLSVAATGDTVTTVLPTYLMESGSLCDGSKYDSRGAYCRFVATGVSISVLGCSGDASVTTTATEHPITDRELHDITVKVDTKKTGSGTAKSTCSFRYLIDEL